MEIKYSRNVIGCKVGNEVFLNPALKKGSKLHRAILSHESKHSSGITFKDLKLDFNNQDLKKVKKEYWNFMFKHPRAFLSFLPISKVGNYWAFDVALFLIWLFAIGVFSLAVLTI